MVTIEEKSCLTEGFHYDLMMILDSGLLFWPLCINMLTIYRSKNIRNCMASFAAPSSCRSAHW